MQKTSFSVNKDVKMFLTGGYNIPVLVLIVEIFVNNNKNI
jgi:hypothetical protein